MTFITQDSEGEQAPYGVNKTNIKYLLIVLILAAIVGGGILAYQYWWLPKQPAPSIPLSTPPSIPDETANWKTYVDEELRFSIQYPPDILLPRSSCDSFILTSSEEEKKMIKNIRDSGIEIGYEIRGLELGFCNISPDLIGSLNDVKNYQLDGVHIPTIFAGQEAIQVEFPDRFGEIYIQTPLNKIMRIWYKYGDDSYKKIAIKMLSIFRFIGDKTADFDKISVNCQIDDDCMLINKDLGFRCCWADACGEIDYSLDKYIAVNKESFLKLREGSCPEGDVWQPTTSEDKLRRDEVCGPPPLCPTHIINDNFAAKCVNNTCQKVTR